MLTTRYPVEFAYTHQELDALFHVATEEDVEKGGRDDARSAREESETIGTFDVHWDPLAVYDIETNEASASRTFSRSSADWS